MLGRVDDVAPKTRSLPEDPLEDTVIETIHHPSRGREAFSTILAFLAVLAALPAPGLGQMIDRTQAPNGANDGINKSLADQVGAGRGDWTTPESASFIIAAIRSARSGAAASCSSASSRGRRASGPGIRRRPGRRQHDDHDRRGSRSDSCAGCHGRPRGSAGFGGDVVTRPDSRDAPHLFGLGLKEMLADEITTELRAIRASGPAGGPDPRRGGHAAASSRKGIDYGVDHGAPRRHPSTRPESRASTRTCASGPSSRRAGRSRSASSSSARSTARWAWRRPTPTWQRPARRRRVSSRRRAWSSTAAWTASRPRLCPSAPSIPTATASGNEMPAALVDHLEFYLLNYFKPATDKQTRMHRSGDC